MNIAIDNNGNRIAAFDDPSFKEIRGFCPACNHPVIPCNGHVVRPYFRHESREYCYADWEPETDWHRDIKDLFDIEDQEIIVKIGNNIKKADVRLKNGLVVEMQHSPISYDEIRKRESFYKNIVWVFDATQAYYDGRIKLYGNTLTWTRPRCSLYCYHATFLNIEYDRFVRIYNTTYETYLAENWHSYKTRVLKANFNEFDNEKFKIWVESVDKGLMKTAVLNKEIHLDVIQTTLF